MATNKYSAKLSGLSRVKWGNKTEKQQAKYFAKQFEELGLAIPKYMKNGKMSSKQLASNINKLTKAIQKKIKEEEHKLIVAESKAIDKKIYNKRLAEFKQKTMNYNDMLLSSQGHIRKFLMYNMKTGNVDNVMNFLMGGNIVINGVLSGDYSPQDPLLALYDENTEFAGAKNIVRKIRRMNEKMNLIFTNGKLDEKKLKRVLGPNREYIKQFTQELEKYKASGYDLDYEFLEKTFKKMPSYQQERFLMEALPVMKEKYRTKNDGGDIPQDTDVASTNLNIFIHNMINALSLSM